MDDHRFDSLTRAFGVGRSRRGVLKGLGAAALGAAGLASLKGVTEAAGEPKVGMCHGTGSATNPYVYITVAQSAVPAHQAQGDVVTNLTDVNNCGACGHVCTTSVANASPTCANGQCGYACNSGYQDDGNGGCAITCAEPSSASSYSYTCYGESESCTATGNILSAYCQVANWPWNYVPTSINVNTCSAQNYVISNCNGQLTCGGC